MSTRCQIGFYESATTKIENDGQVFIYKHSDGYPETTLPLLEAFANEFNEKRGLDACYAPARCLQFLTNESDDHSKSFAEKTKRTYEKSFIGYGVDTVIHGDIEYFYKVSPAEITVYQVTGDSVDQWTVVVSVKIKAGVRL